MKSELHILRKSERLIPFESVIQEAVSEIVVSVEMLITLPEVDIIVVDSPTSAIPETGVGGNAYTPHFVMLSIDPMFPHTTDTLKSEIKSTLAHELHHCARTSIVSGYTTLLDACITEGLADHFDIEINGTKSKPWSVAVQGEDLSHLLERARQDFDNASYDYFAWFFGSEAQSLPRWGGYSIGFALVGAYLKRTGKKASDLVSAPARDFIS